MPPPHPAVPFRGSCSTGPPVHPAPRRLPSDFPACGLALSTAKEGGPPAPPQPTPRGPCSSSCVGWSGPGASAGGSAPFQEKSGERGAEAMPGAPTRGRRAQPTKVTVPVCH